MVACPYPSETFWFTSIMPAGSTDEPRLFCQWTVIIRDEVEHVNGPRGRSSFLASRCWRHSRWKWFEDSEPPPSPASEPVRFEPLPHIVPSIFSRSYINYIEARRHLNASLLNLLQVRLLEEHWPDLSEEEREEVLGSELLTSVEIVISDSD